MRVFMIAFACLFLAAPAPARPAKRPIGLDDLAKIKTVGDPQVSPDGKWVAYTAGTVDAEKDKRDTDVWMDAGVPTTNISHS